MKKIDFIGGKALNNNTKKFVLTGLMTALVFVLTFIFPIPVPYTSGYIHLGDSMIYISVIVLGPIYGAFASGVGSMLADLLAGYAQYALPTLIIKSLMALIMGLIIKGKTKKTFTGSAITALLIWMGFTSGSIIFLRNQIAIIGQQNLINMVAGSDADQATIDRTARIVENLPLYMVTGMILLIVILSCMAFILSKRHENKTFNIKATIGMSIAGMCMVMGYFTVETFMYSPVAALLSVPMNMIQFFAGIMAASLFAPAMRKARLITD